MTKINKIFGIGLSRTATHSLNEALNMLGYNVIHYPKDKIAAKEIMNAQYELSILEKYDGITDITVVPFYAQLDKIYPNSKFILTTRNIEDWQRSIKKHYNKNNKIKELYQNTHKGNLRRFLRAAVYGTYKYNYERMNYVYYQHLKNVKEYFEDKPEKLLIINIPNGEGWEKLCPFLNLDIPKTEFPNWNKKYNSY